MFISVWWSNFYASGSLSVILLSFSLQLLSQAVLSSGLSAAMVGASLPIGYVMGSLTATTMRSLVKVCWYTVTQ